MADARFEELGHRTEGLGVCVAVMQTVHVVVNKERDGLLDVGSMLVHQRQVHLFFVWFRCQRDHNQQSLDGAWYCH